MNIALAALWLAGAALLAATATVRAIKNRCCGMCA